MLELTKLSPEDLSVYLTLQNVAQTQVNGINDNGNVDGDFWVIGSEFGGPSALPLFGASADDNYNIVGAIAWIAPGGDPNNFTDDLFNIVDFEPSGNRGVTQVDVYSDLTYLQTGSIYGRNGGFFNTCTVNGTGGQQCPILTDGQSLDVPINIQTGNGDVIDTLTVTFTDQADATAPEPTSLSLLGMGLAGIALLQFSAKRFAKK